MKALIRYFVWAHLQVIQEVDNRFLQFKFVTGNESMLLLHWYNIIKITCDLIFIFECKLFQNLFEFAHTGKSLQLFFYMTF